VVLARDVALAGCQVQGRDVMSAVSVLELDGSGAGCEGEQLMAETDTHDWDLGGFHEAAQVVDGVLTMSWVAGAVGDEDAVKVVSHFVDGEVIGKDCDTCSSADQASQDVLFDTAVDDSNVHVSALGADVEWSLGADSLHQVDLLGVNESLILIGIIFFPNGDSSQRRSHLPQIRDNGTGVDTRDSRNTLTSTPIAQALNSSPVTVLLSVIRNNNTHTLNVRRLKVFQKSMIVSGRRGDTIVADKRLSEDKDLSTIRGVGHRLRVSHKRSREDCLTRNVGLGTERLAMENRPILDRKNSAKNSHTSPITSPTLIVNVARSCEMGVALGRIAGMERPALPSTVARNRACWAIRF
jgi:hypothetical protein